MLHGWLILRGIIHLLLLSSGCPMVLDLLQCILIHPWLITGPLYHCWCFQDRQCYPVAVRDWSFVIGMIGNPPPHVWGSRTIHGCNPCERHVYIHRLDSTRQPYWIFERLPDRCSYTTTCLDPHCEWSVYSPKWEWSNRHTNVQLEEHLAWFYFLKMVPAVLWPLA
jgi:hypothetical protein